MPQARDLQVVNLSYPFGAGLSHETILFDARWQQDGTPRVQGLVVRIKPIHRIVFQDDMFEEQYRLMRALHEDGRVRVARPFWFERRPDLLGAPFFVMEKKRGRVAVTFPPYAEQGWVVEATPSERRALWENSVRALASVQTVPVELVPFLDPPGGPAGPEREWDRWRRFLSWQRESPGRAFLERAWEALSKTRPEPRETGIVWGDARLGNLMVDEDYGVAAVMDWEQTSLGGPLHDLGWWLQSEYMQTEGRGLAHPEGMGTRDQTIALWSEVCGKSAADIDWHQAFAAFKLGCLGLRMNELSTLGSGMSVDSPSNRRMAELIGMPFSV